MPTSLQLTPTLVALTLICAGPLACSDDSSSGGEAASESGTVDESGESGGADTGSCSPGEARACVCTNGWPGTQTCLSESADFGECSDCVDPDPSVCGDELCEADKEDCSSCPEDCGICQDCSEAPSCEGAAIPGVIATHLPALDVPLPGGEGESMSPLAIAAKLGAAIDAGDPGARVVAAALDLPAPPGLDGALEHPLIPALREVFARYPEQAAMVRRQLEAAGMGSAAAYRVRFPDPRVPADAAPAELAPPPASAPDDCEPAKLRMRVAKVIVHSEADLIFKDNIYCAIISEASGGAEIRVTPKTFNLKAGDEYVYSLAEGVVWGQLGEPVAPMGNLFVTYNCLESDETGGFEEFLSAISEAAMGANAIPGAYGWIIPVIGLAADIIGAALALENDDHLFNASQVIPADLQLEMTNGVWWSVERNGTFMLKKWHWELRMEAWGCTDDGIG